MIGASSSLGTPARCEWLSKVWVERDLSRAWPLLITPRTVDLGTPVAFAILSYPNSVELWRARIVVFLSSRCCRWLCGGAIVSVNITLTRRYHNRAKTFRTRLYINAAHNSTS